MRQQCMWSSLPSASLLCSLHAAALTRQIGAPTSSLPRGTKTATSAAAHLAMPFSFRLRALPTWGTADCVDSDAIMKMVYILYREAHGQLGKKEFAGERLMRFSYCPGGVFRAAANTCASVRGDTKTASRSTVA